jgi:hypothetical protein
MNGPKINPLVIHWYGLILLVTSRDQESVVIDMSVHQFISKDNN